MPASTLAFTGRTYLTQPCHQSTIFNYVGTKSFSHYYGELFFLYLFFIFFFLFFISFFFFKIFTTMGSCSRTKSEETVVHALVPGFLHSVPGALPDTKKMPMRFTASFSS